MKYVLLIAAFAGWTLIVASADQEFREDLSAKASAVLRGLGAAFLALCALYIVSELIGSPGLDQWLTRNEGILFLAAWFVAYVVLMFRQDRVDERKHKAPKDRG